MTAARKAARKRGTLTRKSFFVDAAVLRRAKRLLGVATDAEVVRLSIERVTEMEEFWRAMDTSRRSVAPGSFEPA